MANCGKLGWSLKDQKGYVKDMIKHLKISACSREFPIVKEFPVKIISRFLGKS